MFNFPFPYGTQPQMIDYLRQMHKDHRFSILTTLLMNANEDGHVVVDVHDIAQGPKLPEARVKRAIDWLIVREAIALIPFDKRTNEERALSPDQPVYQITGTFILDDGTRRPYISLEPHLALRLNAALTALCLTNFSE